jgi:ABC-2 type transport system permease protein
MASAKVPLQAVNTQGHLIGFAKMFRKENEEWWITRTWIVRTIMWLLIIDGIVFAVVTTPPKPGVPSDQQASGVLIFVIMGGLVSALSIIITMQGSVLDEKKSGTAAWVLSKPLSRSAFILAKLLNNALAALIRVFLSGVGAFLILNALDPNPPALLPFLGGVALIMLHLLFYLTLTLMLGTLFNERGPVIGIPMGVLFAAQLIGGVASAIAQIMPWPLVMAVGVPDALAGLVMNGQPLPTVLPIVATVIWIVVFVSVALWRFESEEF